MQYHFLSSAELENHSTILPLNLLQYNHCLLKCHLVSTLIIFFPFFSCSLYFCLFIVFVFFIESQWMTEIRDFDKDSNYEDYLTRNNVMIAIKHWAILFHHSLKFLWDFLLFFSLREKIWWINCLTPLLSTDCSSYAKLTWGTNTIVWFGLLMLEKNLVLLPTYRKFYKWV